MISKQESTTGSLMVIARSFLDLSNDAVLFQSRAFPPGLGDEGMDLSRIVMAAPEVEEEDGMENFLMPASKLNELAHAQMSHW